MSGKWKECQLGDILTLKRGYDLPKRKRQQGNVPIVSSSGVTGYHNQSKIKAPGVVTGRYGTLGEVYYVEKDFWPLNTTLYVRDFKGNHPLFISYFLRTLNFERQNAAGAVPGVNRNHLHMLPVRIPPLSTQHKIAAILSAYDDLITNNTRRIALLEEMVQTIYGEWFVHFRFPGHEEVEMVETELGKVPEGWEVKGLGKVCTLVVGQSPKSQYYNQESKGLPFHQGVKDFGLKYPSHRVYCTIAKRVAEAEDILFSVRAPVGRLNIANCKLIIGRGLHAIRHKKGFQTFLFYQLQDKFYEEDMMGGGTIYKSVTKSDMLNIELLSPPDRVVTEFEKMVIPMATEIANLTTKNATLREIRDLLLPKLVSGELEVEDLQHD